MAKSRRGLGKGRGKGYKNIIGKDPTVHSQSARGMKQPQRINKRLMDTRLIKSRRLEDKVTGEEYSANAGDYWNLNPNDELEGLRLIDADGIVNENPKKKDLIDEILFDIKTHTIMTDAKKALKKSDMKSTTIGGETFDEKGRFIVDGKPSNTWTFEGIADRWGRKVLSWEEYAKNPSILKTMRGSFFVMDMDNGTNRVWSKKINKDNPHW